MPAGGPETVLAVFCHFAMKQKYDYEFVTLLGNGGNVRESTSLSSAI